MANAVFEPIIGRDFDSIGAQRFAWAGFNRAVEDANLARLAQSQAVRNNYLQQLAEMQRRDAAYQAGLDTRANELQAQFDLSAQNAALISRQREEDQAARDREFKAQMDFANRELEARGEQADAKLALAKEEQQSALEHYGTLYAQNYAAAKAARDKAVGILDTAQSKIDEAESKLAAINAKAKKTEDDIAELTALNRDLPLFKRELRVASSAAKSAESGYERLRNQMTARDFDVDEDRGKIIHSSTGKEWNFRRAVDEAKVTLAAAPAEPVSLAGPAPVFNISPSVDSPETYSGFGIDIPQEGMPTYSGQPGMGRYAALIANNPAPEPTAAEPTPAPAPALRVVRIRKVE